LGSVNKRGESEGEEQRGGEVEVKGSGHNKGHATRYPSFDIPGGETIYECGEQRRGVRKGEGGKKGTYVLKGSNSQPGANSMPGYNPLFLVGKGRSEAIGKEKKKGGGLSPGLTLPRGAKGNFTSKIANPKALHVRRRSKGNCKPGTGGRCDWEDRLKQMDNLVKKNGSLTTLMPSKGDGKG